VGVVALRVLDSALRDGVHGDRLQVGQADLACVDRGEGQLLALGELKPLEGLDTLNLEGRRGARQESHIVHELNRLGVRLYNTLIN